MTDRDRFIAFFEEMGVPYGETIGLSICIGQGWFNFDNDGRFVEVECDEMGCKHPRVVKP